MKFNPLAWIGKLGTVGVAAGIFFGLALPELASFFRPWLAVTIFVILALTMARVDLGHLKDIARRPARIGGATLVIMIVFPLVVGAVLRLSGVWDWSPDLAFAILIMAASPPLMSAPALIYLIGLDGPLAMAILLACVAITPVSVPLIMGLFADASVDISSLNMAIQLFTLIAGAITAAAILRFIAGDAWVRANTSSIDGLLIIALFVFAVAFMDGIGQKILDQPILIGGLTALAFGMAALFILILSALYWSSGRTQAFTMGIVNGNRSVGLIVAAIAGSIPDLTWVYCALAQFPIYLLPFILKLIADRMIPNAALRTGD